MTLSWNKKAWANGSRFRNYKKLLTREDCKPWSYLLLTPILTALLSVTSELSREDMVDNLKRWLSRAKQEGADPVPGRVQAIAELHAAQP